MNPTDELQWLYEKRYPFLKLMEKKLDNHIKELVDNHPRIDRIVTRAKTVSRFLAKANKEENGRKKYSDPLRQIQDQLGIRIITYYISDVEPLSKIILDYLAPIEVQRIVPDDVNEFGYEGLHHILFIPDDLFTPDTPKENLPEFFELQIKTLFQHAWAEAGHDLSYKSPRELTIDQRRKVAFTAAQAWGADLIFNDLKIELLN